MHANSYLKGGTSWGSKLGGLVHYPKGSYMTSKSYMETKGSLSTEASYDSAYYARAKCNSYTASIDTTNLPCLSSNVISSLDLIQSSLGTSNEDEVIT